MIAFYIVLVDGKAAHVENTWSLTNGHMQKALDAGSDVELISFEYNLAFVSSKDKFGRLDHQVAEPFGIRFVNKE